MTKELEAFVNEVKQAQSDYEKMPPHIQRRWPLGRSVSRITFNHLYTLEKALTPPTSEEVCKEIEKWLESQKITVTARAKRVVYSGQSQIFQTDGFEPVGLCGGRDGRVAFLDRLVLSPHLLTLIGRFYESEAKK